MALESSSDLACPESHTDEEGRAGNSILTCNASLSLSSVRYFLKSESVTLPLLQKAISVLEMKFNNGKDESSS